MPGGRVHGPRALRIIGCVFLTVGLVGFVASGYLAWLEYGSARSATADGLIVGFEFGPVVEFVATNGAKYRASSAVRSTFWHTGDHLPVAYAPNDPLDARVDSFAGRWFLPALFAGLACASALIGLGLGLAGILFREPRQVAA